MIADEIAKFHAHLLAMRVHHAKLRLLAEEAQMSLDGMNLDGLLSGDLTYVPPNPAHLSAPWFTGNRSEWEYIGTVSSNSNGRITEGVAEKLMSGKFAGNHFAWNFCGDVWYDSEAKLFREVINRFNVHIDTISAETLHELILAANAKYGDE